MQHSLPVLQRCQRGEEEEEEEGELKLAQQRVRTVPVVLREQVRQPCIWAQVVRSHLPHRERAHGKRRCATERPHLCGGHARSTAARERRKTRGARSVLEERD